MNNLIIAALTFIMLPALGTEAVAKSNRKVKMEKQTMPIEKIAFTDFETEKNKNTMTESIAVDVDYMIDENGKANITYINSSDFNAKSEVVKFIESATYAITGNSGKINSMRFIIQK